MKNIRANLTDTVYPDYCVGFLYTMLPETALGTVRSLLLSLSLALISFSTCTNLSGGSRTINAKNLFWRLLDNWLPQEEDLCLSAAGECSGCFSRAPRSVLFYFQSLTPPLGGHIWDQYLTHCSFLCTIRTIFNPLVLQASSAQDPDFQYVHNLRFPICIFAEFLVYEHLNPLLGNAEFLLPTMCHRRGWADVGIMYKSAW